MIGKIIKGIAGFYYVHDGQDKVYECKAKGIFRNRQIKPLVGDDVEVQILSEEDKEGNIVDILPRQNVLIRPAVANIDQALVFFAAAQPEPNFNLIDRFLVTMERQDVPVIICFNKQDLIDQKKQQKLAHVYHETGYQVCFISTYTSTGVAELNDKLTGKTTVLAGPSGAGKSSFTNLINPEAAMETGEISDKIKRGKHTTRHSQLFHLTGSKDFPIGAASYLMDTPGFSSMYLEDMEAKDLKDYYPDFVAKANQCRFLGCVHIGEPDCSVKSGVEAETISKIRYENYKLLYEELKSKRRY